MLRHKDTRLVQLDRGLHAMGAVIAGMILIGGLLFVRRSLAAERTSLDSSITEAESVLDEADSIRSEHAQLKKRLADLQQRTGELMARIPATAHEAEFLAQLSELASECQLVISSYRPESPVATERYQHLDIELVAGGSFDSLCRFLEGLESLPRLCRLTRLEVESASGDDGSYPVTMKLRIFFAPEHATPANTTPVAVPPAA
ncbi:Pilus assembly protein, PilO [Maioricimonas rarisocia]|uniref:Pilus assembly protein, PilO n=1 Tax=Maioricimonas rarisocia TaxID=2528026 RepID=A0A517ZCG4_9PLAN|nr:type 4a pilus biogenesis protein PilO [Maioricimonas rarisocia]QDU40142.1 Pilus assembly protein, PilO [Maioricimonas rarisocia]